MKPWCHNKPEALDGYWISCPLIPGRKPRFKWVTHRMTKGCMAWACSVTTRDGRPVFAPELSGWDCKGCKWRHPK